MHYSGATTSWRWNGVGNCCLPTTSLHDTLVNSIVSLGTLGIHVREAKSRCDCFWRVVEAWARGPSPYRRFWCNFTEIETCCRSASFHLVVRKWQPEWPPLSVSGAYVTRYLVITIWSRQPCVYFLDKSCIEESKGACKHQAGTTDCVYKYNGMNPEGLSGYLDTKPYKLTAIKGSVIIKVIEKVTKLVSKLMFCCVVEINIECLRRTLASLKPIFWSEKGWICGSDNKRPASLSSLSLYHWEEGDVHVDGRVTSLFSHLRTIYSLYKWMTKH